MDPVTLLSRPSSLSSVSSSSGVEVAAKLPGTGGTSFGQSLADALVNVSKLQNESRGMGREFQAENANVTLEATMISMQQSSLSFQAVVQVRNKLVTAYSEIMSMQV